MDGLIEGRWAGFRARRPLDDIWGRGPGAEIPGEAAA
jgi:hypothetical protein